MINVMSSGICPNSCVGFFSSYLCFILENCFPSLRYVEESVKRNIIYLNLQKKKMHKWKNSQTSICSMSLFNVKHKIKAINQTLFKTFPHFERFIRHWLMLWEKRLNSFGGDFSHSCRFTLNFLFSAISKIIKRNRLFWS